MPHPGRPPQERAKDALAALEKQGGTQTLPEVLISRDVRPLLGEGWFTDALRLGALPGVQFQRGGLWRCDRATFVEWLQEIANGTTANMALGASGGALVSGQAPNHGTPGRSGTRLHPHVSREAAGGQQRAVGRTHSEAEAARKPKTPNTWLSLTAAARWFRVQRHTMERWVELGRIPTRTQQGIRMVESSVLRQALCQKLKTPGHSRE